jgi:metal-responsive CopG/Arc/MetJ family transcriptional regulator
MNPTATAQETETPETEEMVRFTVELPLSLHRALSLWAVTDRTSRAAIIRRLLKEALQKTDS